MRIMICRLAVVLPAALLCIGCERKANPVAGGLVNCRVVIVVGLGEAVGDRNNTGCRLTEAEVRQHMDALSAYGPRFGRSVQFDYGNIVQVWENPNLLGVRRYSNRKWLEFDINPLWYQSDSNFDDTRVNIYFVGHLVDPDDATININGEDVDPDDAGLGITVRPFIAIWVALQSRCKRGVEKSMVMTPRTGQSGRRGRPERSHHHGAEDYPFDSVSPTAGSGRRQRRGEEQATYRNGYKRRTVATGEGPVELHVPQTRNGAEPFSTQILDAYRRRSETLGALVPALYIKGLSVRDVSDTFVQIFEDEGLSPATWTDKSGRSDAR